jgi:transposase
MGQTYGLIPFQDIRMVKVRQKILRCFRTLGGAQIFARIRGYLPIRRKQGHNLREAIRRAEHGQPFMPKVSMVAL